MYNTKEIHYLVDKSNFKEFQIYFFNKGYKWIDDKPYKIFNAFKENNLTDEFFIIHLFESETTGFKRFGWDRFEEAEKYDISKFLGRKDKLNRIINGNNQ